MPDVSLYTKLAMGLRQFPLIHRPLRWLRRKAFEPAVDAGYSIARRLSPPLTRLGPPSGSFSIIEELDSRPPRREGRVIVRDQGAPKTNAGSLMVRCRLTQHCEQPRPIFWSHHRKARLVGASLALMDERKRLALESVFGPRYAPFDPSNRYLALPPPTRLAGHWTSLVSRWTPADDVPTFSHWLLDALPRLALLEEFPADTGILVPARLAGYQKESLCLLGLLERVRHTPERHLEVESYYFSSPTTVISCYNPYGVAFLRSAFLPKADANYSGPRRFFIQRKAKTRGIQNDAEVTAYFRELGWAIINTEELTLAQEIKLFSQAEAIAGVLGSGFTNCVWSPPGCAVITFVADSWLDGWVEWIAEICRLRYAWQVFPSDHEMRALVDLREVRRMLASLGLESGR
jgi:hypothetical protein